MCRKPRPSLRAASHGWSVHSAGSLITLLVDKLLAPWPKQGRWLPLWLAAGYFLLGKVSYALLPASNSLLEGLFLPEGVSLALGLLLGPVVVPGVLVGQFLLSWANLPASHAAFIAASNMIVLLVGIYVLRACRFNPAVASARDYLLLVLACSLILQPLSRALGWWMLLMDTRVPFSWSGLWQALDLLALENAVSEVLISSAVLAFVAAVRRRLSWHFWLSIAAACVLLVLLLRTLFFHPLLANLHPMQVISLLYLLVMLSTARFEMLGAVCSCLLLFGVIQLAAQGRHGEFLLLVGVNGGQHYFNVFLTGIVYSAGLLGALLREKSANEAKLAQMAHQDYLTGIANRRYFYVLAERELLRVRRNAAAVALLWIDIDHFKQINDRYGHAVGDEVLVFFADVLRRNSREGDLVARIGGEEFAAMALDTGDIPAFGQRVRHALQQALADRPGMLPFTVSIGATLLRQDDPGIDAAFKRADIALYQAKQGGRDRVAICH